MSAPRIFISYRREDAAHAAGHLAASLRKHDLGQIFHDVAIGIGQNFVRRIREEILASDVVLVLIGPNWLGAVGDDGRRRIENELDWVHLELRTALECGVAVVPVFIDGAGMPRPADLPEAVRDLVYLQAGSISATYWERDVSHLAGELATFSGTHARKESVASTGEGRPATGAEAAAAPARASGTRVEQGRPASVDETGAQRTSSPHAAAEREDVVVVAARHAYGEYLEASAYVCQPGRHFRPSARRLGFYFDRLLRPEVPEILHVRDRVGWHPENAIALRERGSHYDAQVAELIERSRDPNSVWFDQRPNDRYEHFTVFLLSGPQDGRTMLLPEALYHDGTSAFTMKHRYVDSARLQGATGTRDL